MKNDSRLRQLTESGMSRAEEYEAGEYTRKDYDNEILKAAISGKSVIVLRGRVKYVVQDSLRYDGFRVSCKHDNESGMYWTRVEWGKESPEKKLTLWIGVTIAALLLLCVGLLINKII